MSDVDAIQALTRALAERRTQVRLMGTYSQSALRRLLEQALSSLPEGKRIAGSINYSSKLGLLGTTVTIEYPRAPKSGGIGGALDRFFGLKPRNEQPTQTPQRYPHLKPPTTKNDNPPSPQSPENGIVDIDAGRGDSFLSEISIEKGTCFHIHTPYPDNAAAIFMDASNSARFRSEGILNMPMRIVKGQSPYLEISFDLGMSREKFFDHLAKGKRTAAPVMKRLTHGGDLPKVIIAMLAYAFFQKEVTYAREYIEKLSKGGQANADMHMAYGPLQLKKGVCEGYAYAYVHMLAVAGIPAEVIYGTGPNGGNHAWVRLELDDDHYYSDPTIGSEPGTASLQHFLFDDAKLRVWNYRPTNAKGRTSGWRYDGEKVLAMVNANREEYIRKGADPTIIGLRLYC